MKDKSYTIEIDFLQSKEIDLSPKEKKRMKLEEYDYNDDFLEHFEGDNQLVDLDCNIENFFVYKGNLTGNPKKIARKYNNKEKKNMSNTFIFENNLFKGIKRDSKFHNMTYWWFYYDVVINNGKNMDGNNIFAPRLYLEIEILKNMNIIPIKSISNSIENDNKQEINSSIDSNQLNINKINCTMEDINKYLEQLKNHIIDEYESLKIIFACRENYKDDFKLFNFKIPNIAKKLIQFVKDYLIFYYKIQDEYIRMRIVSILTYLFPETCTNAKIKFFLTQCIKSETIQCGYDVKELIKGKFVLLNNKSME